MLALVLFTMRGIPFATARLGRKMRDCLNPTMSKKMRIRLLRPSAALLLLFGLTALGGCAVNPVSGDTQLAISESREIAIGRESDPQVRREYGVYDNPSLQAYVNEVGQRLAQHSHRSNLQWTFTVVDSPEINAFALPGGYVYITRGLMAYLNSEAELAGVLGHEIGHVTARHGAQQQAQSQVVGIGALAMEVLGQVYLNRGGAGQLASQAGQGLWLLPNSREHELEADRLGAEYLQRIGQDPATMIAVLKVLKQNEVFNADEARALGKPVSKRPNYLSTHPSNDQRLAEIDQIAAQYSGKYEDAGRDRYLKKIDGMTFGDSAAQGIVRGQRFYHAPLKLTLSAPSGWKIQNEPEQLLIVSPDEQAAVLMVPAGTHGDLDAAIGKLKADSGRMERSRINELDAVNFVGSRQGAAIEATAITLDNNDYVLRPLAKSAEARERWRTDSRAIINGFRAMNAADVAAAKPYTLRIMAAPASGLARLQNELSHKAPQIRNPEGQLRLLNQVYPEGDIGPGQPIKTLQ